jgi:N,N-dimethylformamidase
MIEKRMTGYCAPLCAAPGETVRFMVSCDGADPARDQFEADIVRVHCGDDTSNGAGFRESVLDTDVSGRYRAREQSIYPGSCVLVDGTSPDVGEGGVTLAAYVFPTQVGSRRLGAQHLVGSWHAGERRGYALVVDDSGALALRLGGAEAMEVATDVALAPNRWSMVFASFDPATARVVVAHKRAPLTIAACVATSMPAHGTETGLGGRAHGWRFSGFFNGKIDAPRCIEGAVELTELEHMLAPHPESPLAARAIGWWDFSQRIDTEFIVDRSRQERHGRTIQMPARAVTGHNWDSTARSWTERPEHYAAIHFHDDDLVDAEWAVDVEFSVPSDMPSGIYALRIRREDTPEGLEGDDHITFFVRPPRDTRHSDVAYLIPSASYLAYGNSRLHLRPSTLFGSGDPEYVNDAYLKTHPEVGSSLYDLHSDFSGVQYSSQHRPLLNMKPRHNRIWQFPADTNISNWMENKGFAFDVLTDEMLHREGAELLSGYRVVVTGTHPEYYSTDMLDGLETYLAHGGRLMYMGGNGFYWRIAYHREVPGIIEVRRTEDGTRAWMAQPGEYHQAFDGEYGGLWRRIGRPPNRLVGVGFAAQGFDRSTYYRRQVQLPNERVGFVFEGVTDEIIGDFGSLGGGASGEEIDRLDVRLGSPQHAVVLASSENHDQSMLRTKEEYLSTVLPFDDPKVRSDLVFFECPNGGAVFSTGSITWGASLGHDDFDNNVSRITENVLRRFLEETPFEYPPDEEG